MRDVLFPTGLCLSEDCEGVTYWRGGERRGGEGREGKGREGRKRRGGKGRGAGKGSRG